MRPQNTISPRLAQALAEALYVAAYGAAAARQHPEVAQRVGGRLAGIAAEHLAPAPPAEATTEWGVRYEADRDTVIYEPKDSEDAARREVDASPTDTALVSREVGPWREVSR